MSNFERGRCVFLKRKFIKNRFFAGGGLSLAIFSCAALGFSSFIETSSNLRQDLSLTLGEVVVNHDLFDELQYDVFEIIENGILQDDIFTNIGRLNISFNVNNSTAFYHGYTDETNYFKFRMLLSSDNTGFLSFFDNEPIINNRKC